MRVQSGDHVSVSVVNLAGKQFSISSIMEKKKKKIQFGENQGSLSFGK